MSLEIRKEPSQPDELSNQERTTNQYQNGHSQNRHRRPHNLHALHDGKRVTEDEYWQFYYEKASVDGDDSSYEWNNGVLEAKPMPNRVQLQEYYWFHEILGHFLKVHAIATMIFLEIGFRMEIPDPKKPGKDKVATRKPDIGIVLDDNEVPWLDDQRSYHGIFDMIVESLSDSEQSEIDRDTIHKKAEYEAAGVREYFILDPSEAHQHFYRLDDNDRYVEISPENGLIRSEVLPGFQFRVSDLLTQPALEEMAQDEVYQHFVLPAYQAALRQVEEERLRAEEERLRAEKAESLAKENNVRAERFKQMLRDLGAEESELE